MSLSINKLSFQKPDDNSYISDRDLEPVDENKTNFIFNSHHNKSIEIQRSSLPITKYKNHILYCLENYQTLILIGETGCGKSTQVPQYLQESQWHIKGLIGVTEPRRVAALALADRVSLEQGDVLGNKIGVSVRFIDKVSENTQIKFMTEGILIREILADPLLSNYSVIIVDEAHERNLLTDTLLALLKKIAKKRPSLKIIISSATVDSKLMKDFFNIPLKEFKNKDTSIILSVEGRMHPVDVFYLNEPTPNYLTCSVETVIKIHKNEPMGDILVFLTGQEEVLEVVNQLKIYSSEDETLSVLPMYGSLSVNDQLKVCFNAAKGTRKVIVATNVAETSITIPGIVYVIDSGFVKLRWFTADNSIDSLLIIPISKAAAMQRSGRAGRVKPGKTYRLYTEKEFEKFAENTPPEMRRTELSSIILYLKALGIENIFRFDFITPPPAKHMLTSIELLYALNALDDLGNLTPSIGYFLAEFPINAMLGKMFYSSAEMGCSEEILNIIAILQVQYIFAKPVSGQAQIKARIAKRNFEVAEGDLITYLNVFTAFVKNGRTKEFCDRYFLIYRNLKRAYEIKLQLSKLALQFGLPLLSCNGDVMLIRKCITAGLFPNAAYLHHSGVYKTIRGDIELNIHPLSSLYLIQQPQYIIFCELLQTKKFFMKDLTVIQPEWLLEYAPHYYHKSTVKDY